MDNNYINFNKLFNEFQKKSRTMDGYQDFEAFKDMKIIINKYVQLYDNRGYKYYDLSVIKIRKMLSGFDLGQKKDLLSFFIKKLVLSGNTEKAKEMVKYLNEIEIKNSWNRLKCGKEKMKNLTTLLHKCSGFNLWTLVSSIFIIMLFSALIFFDAPFECMEVLRVEKKQIVSQIFFNNLFNVLLYIFDTDYKMQVEPLNGLGVLLMILLKALFIVVMGNYLVKELLDKLKIS